MGATVAALVAAATTDLVALSSSGAEVQGAALDSFMAVSRLLTGRSQLDGVVGARLLVALEKNAPDFASGLPQLAIALKAETLDATQEATALKIMQAWYVGMVDKTVVTYEQALMFDAVSDNLSIRSYAGGAPGFWAKDPT
ncbi:sugar dehydrogenase complex small subunit [Rhodanobacter umsongensis]